jgi:glycosyltransferase involved in cell wall biosynthesis
MTCKVYPKISVVIPFYNAGERLLDAIKSVLVQTYNNWELILLDDGSTDGMLEKLSKIKDERIRLISDGENRGLAARLNQMPELCTGSYIARMDADDIMFPNRLSWQYDYCKNNNVDVLSTGVVIFDADYILLGERSCRYSIGSFSKWVKSCPVVHPTVFASKKWFSLNKYDESLRRAQDRELWLRTVDDYVFVNAPEPLLFYNVTLPNSIEKIFLGYKSEREAYSKIKRIRDKPALFYSLCIISIIKQMIRIISYMLPSCVRGNLNAHNLGRAYNYSQVLITIRNLKIPGLP